MPLCLVNKLRKKFLFSNYLAQISDIANEKTILHTKKKTPQKIFQQGYLAEFTSRVNFEMLYHNRVEEPKYCSGISENVRLPQNLLQKFKK